MSLRYLLRALTAKPEPTTSYREPVEYTPAESLREIEALVAAKSMRIRVLERQLAAAGIEPAETPEADELREVVEILDRLSRCEYPRQNTVRLRMLADTMRGLATWGLE